MKLRRCDAVVTTPYVARAVTIYNVYVYVILYLVSAHTEFTT